MFTSAVGIAPKIAEVAAGPFPDVAGYDLLVGWRDVVKSKGVYDWTELDTALTAVQSAGKVANICMLPGFAEPSYVLTECPTVQIEQFNSGQLVTMAVPTSPAFLVELCSWIAALGSHLTVGGDTCSLQATGLGDQGEMVLGKCVTGVWADYGITAASLLAAWQQVINAWATADNAERSLAIAEPLGPNEPVIAPLIVWLAANHPHMAMQQNGLKATTPTGAGSFHADIAAWVAAGRVGGWQMFGLGSQNGDLRTALEIGLSAGATFFQIYLNDVLNPANAATFQWLNQQLAK